MKLFDTKGCVGSIYTTTQPSYLVKSLDDPMHPLYALALSRIDLTCPAYCAIDALKTPPISYCWRLARVIQNSIMRLLCQNLQSVVMPVRMSYPDQVHIAKD
jgi:hypothetical protein